MFNIFFYSLLLRSQILFFPTISFPAELTLNDLLQKPNQFVGQNIIVRGKLKYVGKNYFSDPISHFILEDGSDQVPIAPWLPLEIFVSPSDGSTPRNQRPKAMIT